MKQYSLFFVGCLTLLVCQTSLAIPTIQHWQTEKGARVYFVPAHELPMVDVEVTFDAGSARDNSKAGLATLVNGLLNEGAGGYSADHIAEQLDKLGAQFDHDVTRDTASVGLRSLSDPNLLQPAITLLAQLLAHPDFETMAIERVRQQMLASLKHQQQSPDSIANIAFYQAVFPNHPYASSPEGTPETVAALTQADLQAFHQRYYVARNAVVAIVGDLDRPAAEKLANTVVGQLATGKAADALPSVPPLQEAKTILIAHPSTQTHILIGQPGVARGDADYFALYIGNYILGGSGLVSKLSDEIRQQRGLAYSTYSYFFPLQVSGPFIAGLETRNNQREAALKIVLKTLETFVHQGPTPEVLEKAKQGITGQFPLRIKSNSNIIGYLSIIGFYHLPLDYLHRFNQNIEAVTLDDIKDAFQRRLQLDKLVTVMVGEKNASPVPPAKGS